MKPVRTFSVAPALPSPLHRLRELAYNLRWAWDSETIELFRRLDADLWEATGHNPVALLGLIDQDQLAAAAANDGFLAHLERICHALDAYLAGEGNWFDRSHGPTEDPPVVYFSAEFG